MSTAEDWGRSGFRFIDPDPPTHVDGVRRPTPHDDGLKSLETVDTEGRPDVKPLHNGDDDGRPGVKLLHTGDDDVQSLHIGDPGTSGTKRRTLGDHADTIDAQDHHRLCRLAKLVRLADQLTALELRVERLDQQLEGKTNTLLDLFDAEQEGLPPCSCDEIDTASATKSAANTVNSDPNSAGHLLNNGDE